MPARPPKSTQQPKDPYAQAGKALASQVQRLRGWLSTDASRLPELVDALTEDVEDANLRETFRGFARVRAAA